MAVLAAGLIWGMGQDEDSRGVVAQPKAADDVRMAEGECLRRAEPASREQAPEPELAQLFDAPEHEPLALADDSGLATLDLRVLDRADGQGLASKVELWQLDLPQDLEYQAGNHLRGSIDLPPEGGRVEGLPPGRYRALVFRRARHTEDPPEFVLYAGVNQIGLPIDPPNHERWWVRVVDEFGRPIEDCREHRRSRYFPAQVVPFAVQRARLGDPPIRMGGGGGGSFGIRGRRRARDRGFDLGVWREPTAESSVSRVPWLEFEGRSYVEAAWEDRVCVRSSKSEDEALPQRHFVAVSLPGNYFDTSFCDHRGSAVPRDQVQIRVEASLIEIESGAPIPLDRLRVAVSARWEGGNWTTWGHDVADGPPSGLRLSPRE